jgi:GMP synthase-like glutamine amidotransferase
MSWIELDVLAQTYLSSETQQALQNEYGSAKVELFATAWTHFEAVAKANEKNGIVQEDIHLTQTVHTWNITNLPAGIVGCAVVV